MNLRTKYLLLRATTIFLGAVSIPLSTYIGFCFGEGRFSTGLGFLVFQTALSLTDGYIWFWVLEHMDAKVREESRQRQAERVAENPGTAGIEPDAAAAHR